MKRIFLAILFLCGIASAQAQTATPTPSPTATPTPTPGQVGLHWMAPTSGPTVTGYNLWQHSGSSYVLLKTLPATPLNYYPSIPGVVYALSALAGTSESPISADATGPFPPTGARIGP